MTAAREAFLQRVRRAVQDGNRVGQAPLLPERGGAGYQGEGTDPVTRFRNEFTASGGQAHAVGDTEVATACVLKLVEAKAARSVLIGRGAALDNLNLGKGLNRLGVEILHVDGLQIDAREPL